MTSSTHDDDYYDDDEHNFYFFEVLTMHTHYQQVTFA